MPSFVESGVKVGIVGATGAVGLEVITCLAHIDFPMSCLALYASQRSAGKVQSTPYGDIAIELFTVEAARTCQYVLMAVSGDFAKANAKLICADNGPYVIDNSSAFRYDDDIPLVVPEINGKVLSKDSKLIANPNCTTAVAAVALYPIHLKYKIKKLIMSTYQAASGAGVEGMDELMTGSAAVLKEEAAPATVFAHPLAFNLIPHIDKFQGNGYTKEEMKVAWETNKIFNESPEDLKVSCTAVRVPIIRAHSEAITIETDGEVDLDEVRTMMKAAAGVTLVDDVTNNQYPMPLNATAQYDVMVGRIRESLVFGQKGMDLFVSGDQLLRGAAWNAVLIADYIRKLE